MSKTEENVTTEKEEPKSLLGFAALILLIAAILVGFVFYKNAEHQGDQAAHSAVDQGSVGSKSTGQVSQSNNAGISTADLSTDIVDLDITALATPRIMGNPNAPVKISEHSSFTCSHCGAFHKTNLKDIKKDFIDTGKAYLVFDDFPRNRVDVFVGAIARCVPEDAYFNYVQMVFETQEEWLGMEDKYIDFIKQNAKMAGTSGAQVEACLNSQDLHNALAERGKLAHDNHDVTGTPTLVINDTVKISGLAPYEELKAALNAAYEGATGQAE